MSDKGLQKVSVETLATAPYPGHRVQRSVAAFECAEQCHVERIVEVVGDDETSLVDTEHRPGVFDGNEPRHRPPRPHDDDVFSGGNLLQQPGRNESSPRGR